MANKPYSIVVNGTQVWITDCDGEFQVRICAEAGHKTFTTVWEDTLSMVIRAIMAPYAVFIGEDPNITLAVGFQDEEMALTWMRQLPPEDGRKAWMVTSAVYFDSNSYCYL